MHRILLFGGMWAAHNPLGPGPAQTWEITPGEDVGLSSKGTPRRKHARTRRLLATAAGPPMTRRLGLGVSLTGSDSPYQWPQRGSFFEQPEAPGPLCQWP